jgi:hypothetical protein
MSSDSNKNNSLASLLKSMGGDDCDRPACDDTKSALSAALKRVGTSSGGGAGAAVSSLGGDASSDTGGIPSGSTVKPTKQSSSSKDRKGRLPNSYNASPPTKDAIGASTWALVHSMVGNQFSFA